MILHCTKMTRDLRRDIDITNSQENHVGKGVKIPESTGAILDYFDDTVESLGYCIGESRTDKGQDFGKVVTEGVDELLQGLQTAPESSCGPALEESFCGTGICVIPELFKLIFQSPRPEDAVIGSLQGFESACVFSRSSG